MHRYISCRSIFLRWTKKMKWGSGCGSVGRAVASNTIGPRFNSSHQQNLYWTFVYLFTIDSIEKTKKIKKGRVWPTFFKKWNLICSEEKVSKIERFFAIESKMMRKHFSMEKAANLKSAPNSKFILQKAREFQNSKYPKKYWLTISIANLKMASSF